MKYKGEVGEVWQVNYEHTYLASSFPSVGGNRRHWCLAMGDWCWKNLREHPLDISKYITVKLREKKKD